MWFGGDKPIAVPQVTLSAEVEHKRGEHWKTDKPAGFKNPWPSAKGEQVSFLRLGFGWRRLQVTDNSHSSTSPK